MTLLDRHILIRFGANFAILFALLFVFAATIDVVVNLDEFVDAARSMAGKDAGWLRLIGYLIVGAADFQAPRLFQFYAYLHGIVAIGAMGFTLAQMHRYRELVAIMSSGVSLHRVAMPFIIAVFGLSLLQLLNQELILPRVAPLLLRGMKNIGQGGVNEFAVGFTADARGNLLQAPTYDPNTRTLQWPTFLERDDRGRTTQRISAKLATWSDNDEAWKLTEGKSVRPAADRNSPPPKSEAAEWLKTDLSPDALMVGRYRQFAAMLSMKQISQMLQTPRVTDRDSLLRYRYSRFSSAIVNLLILALALPCFLLREPANLLRQSVLCAGLAVPASVGSAIGMMAQLPGIPPAVSVFLPVICLGFMAIFPWTFLKT